MQLGMEGMGNWKETDDTTFEHWHRENMEEGDEEERWTKQTEEYGKEWGASQEEEL